MADYAQLILALHISELDHEPQPEHVRVGRFSRPDHFLQAMSNKVGRASHTHFVLTETDVSAGYSRAPASFEALVTGHSAVSLLAGSVRATRHLSHSQQRIGSLLPQFLLDVHS